MQFMRINTSKGKRMEWNPLDPKEIGKKFPNNKKMIEDLESRKNLPRLLKSIYFNQKPRKSSFHSSQSFLCFVYIIYGELYIETKKN